MFQLFIRFPEFAEFTEFDESSAPFRKNFIVKSISMPQDLDKGIIKKIIHYYISDSWNRLVRDYT